MGCNESLRYLLDNINLSENNIIKSVLSYSHILSEIIFTEF